MSAKRSQLTTAQVEFARQHGARVPPHAGRAVTSYAGMVFMYGEDVRWLVDPEGDVVDVAPFDKLAA
jgi:hypothetical protein